MNRCETGFCQAGAGQDFLFLLKSFIGWADPVPA